MNNTRTLIHIVMALCSLALILAVVDFGAFTDIYHDFMGTRVPELLDIQVSADQIQRTSTSLEWGAARISWLLRVAILILCIGTLLKLRRGNGQEAGYVKTARGSGAPGETRTPDPLHRPAKR